MAMRARRAAGAGERGFTLVEVLVALLIVATTVATLQTISSATLRQAVETNRMRIAKMLLRQKAEEIVAGTETGSSGGFDGFPGYDWESSDNVSPVTIDDGSGNQPESVRTVTVTVHMPSMSNNGGVSPDLPASEDGPGTVRLTTLLDPVDAELKPPAAAPAAGGSTGGGR